MTRGGFCRSYLGPFAAIFNFQVEEKLDKAGLGFYGNREELQDHNFDPHVFSLALQPS